MEGFGVHGRSHGGPSKIEVASAERQGDKMLVCLQDPENPAFWVHLYISREAWQDIMDAPPSDMKEEMN